MFVILEIIATSFGFLSVWYARKNNIFELKQVFSTKSGITVIEVPAPLLQEGNILVEVKYSFISSGTESASITTIQSNLATENSYLRKNSHNSH